MSKPYFDIVSKARATGGANATFGWHRVGRAWIHAATADKPASLSLQFNSLPSLSHDIKLFPPPDQKVADCVEMFRVVAPISVTSGEGDESTVWHDLGLAYYNPPTDDRAENFRLMIWSLPLQGRAMLFPQVPEESTAA